MKIDKATEIIHLLSQGIDPITGEEFDSNSPYQQADIIRALYLANDVLEKEQKRVKSRNNLPDNAGKPWFEEEDDRLVAGFDSGKTINELAKEHLRTVGSIQSRLVRHGKISYD
jgi:hypothetical protein